jgi:hypothetical protein
MELETGQGIAGAAQDDRKEFFFGAGAVRKAEKARAASQEAARS